MKKTREFKDYIEDIKKAKKYIVEIKKIRKENKLDEKENFIKKAKSYMKDINFLILLGSEIDRVYSLAKTAKACDNFFSIMDKFNIDIEGSNFDFDDVELFEDRCWYYSNYYHDYIEDKNDVGSIKYDTNVVELIECLEKFETYCTKELMRIKKEREIEELRKKEEAEKAEYELYLKLKEKFEQ